MAATTNSTGSLNKQQQRRTRSFHLPRAGHIYTLLERDAIRAIGETVFDRPRWWESFENHKVLQMMLHEVAMRTIKRLFRDSAAHVLDWTTPVARRVLAAKRERCLSSLVDFWPIEFARNTTANIDGQREVLPSNALIESDRYFVFAWVMLRQVCLNDAQRWPASWGEATCSCLSIRPLMDAVVIAMIDCLDRVRNQSQHQPACVVTEVAVKELLQNDETASQFLRSFATLRMPRILLDFDDIKMFALQYLETIISRHRLLTTNSATTPAPLEKSFLCDYVEANLSVDRFNETAKLVEFQLDDDSSITETVLFEADGSASVVLDQSELGQAIEALVPAFESTLSDDASDYGKRVGMHPFHRGVSGWITMPTRRGLRKSVDLSLATTISLTGRRLQTFVRVDKLESDSDWRENDWAVRGRPRVGAAVVMYFAELENVAAARVVVKVPSLFEGESTYHDTTFYGDCDFVSLRREKRGSHKMVLPPTHTRDLSVELYSRLPSALTEGTSLEYEMVAISGLPHRAIVLPAYAKFRIQVTALDPSRPHKCTVLTVSLRNPYHYAAPKDLLERLKLPVENQCGSCSMNIWPTTTRSYEELRFGHYEYHRLPGSRATWGDDILPRPVATASRLLRTRPSRSAMNKSRNELEMLRLIGERTDKLQWWILRSGDDDQAWKDRISWLYLRLRIGDSITRQSRVTFNELRPFPRDQLQFDADVSKHNDFASVSLFFNQLELLRIVHNGIMSGQMTPLRESPSVIANLLDAYRHTEDPDSRHSILAGFVGRDYPVHRLMPRMNEMCESFNAAEIELLERVASVVQARRSEISGRRVIFSPVIETAVCDDMLSAATIDGFVAVLKSMGRMRVSCLTGDVAFDRVVDPSYFASDKVAQSIPTFAVRQNDAIAAKLDAVICPMHANANAGNLAFVHWVPSDVIIDLDNVAHIKSYVYGVPVSVQSAFTHTLKAVFTSVLPLFEHGLSGLANDEPAPQFWTGEGDAIETPGAKSTIRAAWALRGRALQIVVEVVEINVRVGAVDHPCDPWHEAFSRRARNISGSVFLSALIFLEIRGLEPPQISFRYSGAKERDSLGLVTGYPGRCVVYPSLLEPSFQPVNLSDVKQPGSILVLQIRMVSPEASLVSTANVMPQQQDAIIYCTLGLVTRFFNLPADIHSVIASMLEWDGFTPKQLLALQVKRPHSCYA